SGPSSMADCGLIGLDSLLSAPSHYYTRSPINNRPHDFLLLAQPRPGPAGRLERVTLDDIARQAEPTPSIHNTEPITMDDVIIIGGSFAGLAGALQLGRARRKVTVLDTGLPRNRFAGHSHGL